jgi:methionyl-tRNA formyltransferase
VPSLRALCGAGHRILLVVTQPDRPGHRRRLTPPAVKVAAQELDLPVAQPERIREADTVETLARLAPELGVVVAYGQIVPRAVLDVPRRGIVNVHGSLLPRWRGAAPVAHAILAGDPVTGVSIMQMDEELDHGPVLAQRETPIGEHESAAELAERLADLGASLLTETLAGLDAIQPREQDHGAATRAGKLQKADGELDWDLAAAELDRRVRAFHPWPGVTLPYAGRRVKVLRGHLGREELGARGQVQPGSLLEVGGRGVEVATAHGSYVLQEVQVPGGRPGPARSLLHEARAG